MKVVIDTNVLVSALYSKNGAPARVLALVISGEATPCFDFRILEEYRDVLSRKKFGFSESSVNDLLKWITSYGLSLVPSPLGVAFADESGKKFYEVAKCAGAVLVTGNLRHFPTDGTAISVNDFLNLIASSKR